MGKSRSPRHGRAGGKAASRKSHESPKTTSELAERYRALLKLTPSAVLVFDRDSVVLEANRAAGEMMGVAEEQLVGVAIRDLLGPELQPLLEAVLAGEPATYEGKVDEQSPKGKLWVRSQWAPLLDRNGALCGGIVVALDVSAQQRAEELVEKLAFFDPLTELPNRTMLTTLLERELSDAVAHERQLALVWLDIDRFKDANDALGLAATDRLLCAVARRLTAALRSGDVVARVSGDDFLLLLHRVNSHKRVNALMARITRLFSEPFTINGEPLYLTASCGVAVHPEGGEDSRALQENARNAMQSAKSRGGNGYQLFASSLSEDRSANVRLAAEIREAVKREQFIFHYQPQIELARQRVVGLEALARWQHPERGLLAPVEFIPFAERSGLIESIGRQLVPRACAQLDAWRRKLDQAPRLALNVSPRELLGRGLVGTLSRTVEQLELAPAEIEIEITETAILADPGRAARVVARLREAGFTIALDDFGTGFSSLTHLREFPIDRVKLDRSFVSSCASDASAAAILESVTSLAHRLGLEVIGEGVETDEQLLLLQRIGCDIVQGYLLSKPLPAPECEAFLVARQSAD